MVPVIMSGGVGSRLWPASREAHPKPFMELADGENLIQKAFRRATHLPGVTEILTVTNKELFFKTEDEYRKVGAGKVKNSFILEPFGRNTAAAVALAALQIESAHGPDALMLVLAADHLINDEAAYTEAVNQACQLANQGWLVTFGIQPDYPETGFGYIEVDSEEVLPVGMKVSRFVEKPDLATANEYLRVGGFFWNSGMFCFRVVTILDQFQVHAPEILLAAKSTFANSVVKNSARSEALELDAQLFSQVPEISIDYAILERAEKVATIPCAIGWSDIGSWGAFAELTKADEQGNRFQGEVIQQSARNNYVLSPERLTALVGVENLIVVDTPDALLVMHKSKAQEVKQIVSQLKQARHAAHLLHRTVHRPWGTYTTLEEEERFKIKRIIVSPGQSLSLQMHHHRSEHWIVVSGMARVINGEDEFFLNINESTFIRAGHKHRLENPGVIDLIMIEVQSGDYLGEDDIVRYQDVYGRE